MSHSPFVGYLACAVSVICFGSNFVPAKRINMGDGVFFQFMMCNAIFLTSCAVPVYLDYPEFHSFAMLGGFLWCTGNMLCGPAIQLIGLGLALLLWGSSSMLLGWSSGTFGLFGLKPQAIADPTLNYMGVVLAMMGFLIFLMVKPESQSSSSHAADPVDTNLLKLTPEMKSLLGSGTEPKTGYSKIDNNSLDSSRGVTEEDNKSFGAGMSPHAQRILGLVLSCTAGVFFGCSFNPAQYIIDNVYNGHDDSINYVFPHCAGIVTASWFYFIAYLIYHQYNDSQPYLDSSIIVPGLLSGLFWGIAEIGWFVANGELGFAVSFPIISFGPGLVGAMWGVFVFGEIKGNRNFLTLALAFIVLFPGLLLVGVSH